uniref:Uncharacterized protein n=1 Tax=Hippocampus comes TaxID=109280 RepID=A0A3Q2XI69_HIPCM
MGKVYSQPACQFAYDSDIQQLFSLVDRDPSSINARDDVTGDTPIIAACRGAKLDAVTFLLERHADVRALNKKHRTCLHYVAKQNFSLLDHLIILLLMPILLLGYFLLLQKQRRNEALMKEVLDSDVDVNAADYFLCCSSEMPTPTLTRCFGFQDGESPLDIAVRLKFTKVVRLLRKTL